MIFKSKKIKKKNVYVLHRLPIGDISKPVNQKKPKLKRWVFYKEPLRKMIARYGAKQSQLKY